MAVGLFSGCTIYDDWRDCDTGVYLSFYNQTMCSVEQEPLVELKNISILAFGEDGQLARQFQHTDLKWNEKGEVYLPLLKGNYQLFVWTGLDHQFTISKLQNTDTSKALLYSLKQNKDKATLDASTQVMMGSLEGVRVVGPESIHASRLYQVNLLEQTNHLTFILELDESIQEDINNFELIISSSNGSAWVNGEMPLGLDPLIYQTKRKITNNVLTENVTVLQLKAGYNNIITIRHKQSGNIIYQADLLGSILYKTPNVNLACENHFNLKFTLKDKCSDCYTYICSSIWVNDWQIHSYETDLEIE